MSRSINEHNVDFNILCDWIEASVVFDREELSKSDVIDALLGNQVYDKQDYAAEIVGTAWDVISRRVEYLSNPLGIVVSSDRIERGREWSQFPAYSFCLVLSCAEFYPDLAQALGNNYVVQGELFEKLAEESFIQALGGWTIRRVGWSPSNPVRLRGVINSIISELNEVASSEIDLHVDNNANELGLDLLVYRPFGDNQASFPVLMVQCASGKNWKSKRHTPDLNIWGKVISFTSAPARGFVVPYAFADEINFRKLATPVNGVFLDRYRLLGAFNHNQAEVSEDLNNQLLAWITPQLDVIPKDND